MNEILKRTKKKEYRAKCGCKITVDEEKEEMDKDWCPSHNKILLKPSMERSHTRSILGDNL